MNPKIQGVGDIPNRQGFWIQNPALHVETLENSDNKVKNERQISNFP